MLDRNVIKKLLLCRCHKVDSNGNVYSCVEQYSSKGLQGIQTHKGNRWYKLKPILKHSGYLAVTVHGKQMRVNRVVALAFIPNPLNLPEVHHRDGIRDNNRLNNLEWGTQQTNADDRDKHGHTMRGSKNGNAKLDETKVLEIMKQLETTKTLQNIANTFGVSKKLILLIKQKRIWQHVTNA